jgi:hypothetical protein
VIDERPPAGYTASVMKSLTLACLTFLIVALAFTVRPMIACAEGPPGETAAEPMLTSEQEAYFEQHVRPLLIQRCYDCHSGEERKGGLSLDTRGGWQRGGDRGAAIVPGNSEESLIVQAVRYADPNLQMPPEGRLADEEIATLEAWVRMGAPDPREEVATATAPAVDPAAGRDHWAYQPLREATPPAVHDSAWPLTDADRWVLARLESQGWAPSPDADRATWLRRVTFDLTGLPPTPAEVEAFLSDESPHAYEAVVDRLLATRAYGERWARPWLDLVGYADQIGSANNVPAEQAWRYRDYVIRSLNADAPFDRFIREQVAGDLLPASSIEERQDQITATGFLVLGNVNIVEADKLVMEMDLVDQQIEKFGNAFLAQTLNCVRCHDHKFDPLTLRDYYGLAGIFSCTESTYKINRGVWSAVTKTTLPETLSEFTAREAAQREHDRQVAAIEQERAAAQARIAVLDPLIQAAKEAAARQAAAGETAPPTAAPASPAPGSTAQSAPSLADLEKERGDLAGKLGALQARLWHLDYLRPGPPVVLSVKDSLTIADARTQIRGNPHVLGDVVPRGFVEVVTHGAAPAPPADQSGRVQLADWLTGPASPLVARVAVNRIWQKLFGRGIVGSVDYFGTRGEEPTHPELLDHLAGRFIADGWSRKRLIRSLVLSRVYRQSAETTETSRHYLASDPENRLLWRMSPRRLEAEMLRDAVLAVSAGLRDCSGGPALAPEFMENVGGLNPADVNPISFALNRFRDDQASLRTIYLPVVRSSEQRGPADTLNFFDFPQPAQYASDRPTTAVASQALFLLNGPLLNEAAARLSAGILGDAALADDDTRLARLYLQVLNRPISAEETSAAREFLAATLAASTTADPAAAWRQLAHALLVSNEFLFRL